MFALYNKTDAKIQRLSRTVGAIIVLSGAATGIATWFSSQIQNTVATQIADLKTEVQTANKKTELQITRLELLSLIHNQPTNVAEIEKIAKHYFQELGGNWYATGLYSKWCQEYGGDPSIAVGSN